MALNTICIPNIVSQISLARRPSGDTPFYSTLAYLTCCLHLDVQYQLQHNRSAAFMISSDSNLHLLAFSISADGNSMGLRSNTWESVILECSHSYSPSPEDSLPCLQNDSRIGPLVDLHCYHACLAPCLPHCFPTDYSSWWSCHSSASNPSVVPCPQNTTQSLIIAHQAPHGPACTTS